MRKHKRIERGDVFIADLSPVKGSEQGGCRPVVVISNELCNRFSPNVICVAVTSKINNNYPTHTIIEKPFVSGTIMAEHIRTISLERLHKKLGKIKDMSEIDETLRISLSL